MASITKAGIGTGPGVNSNISEKSETVPEKACVKGVYTKLARHSLGEWRANVKKILLVLTKHGLA